MAINTQFDVNVLLWGLRGNALSGHLLVSGGGGGAAAAGTWSEQQPWAQLSHHILTMSLSGPPAPDPCKEPGWGLSISLPVTCRSNQDQVGQEVMGT